MNLTQVVGTIAAFTASMLFLPQVIKTVRTRDTKSLSLEMYILNTINNSLWITYGFLSWNYAVLLAQVCLFPMGLVMLFFKIKYG